jgi:hypothetical protein
VRAARAFGPVLGDRSLVATQEAEIAELQAKLVGAGKPAKSVRNILSVLSTALRLACEWSYLEERPQIRHPKRTQRGFGFFRSVSVSSSKTARCRIGSR